VEQLWRWVSRSIEVRKRFFLLGLIAIALGVAVLLYRGPGQPIVRGHVGDVAAAMLVFAIVGAVFSTTLMSFRAILALGIAVAIEVGQAFWHVTSTAGDMILGDTCDPWDIVAYVAGVGFACVWEWIAVARCASCEPR